MFIITPLFNQIASFVHRHPKHLFIFPWVGLVFWYAMLISMLAYWGAEGRPVWHWIYGWDISPKEYKDDYGNVGLIYISDIGATKMQGVFISLSCVQGIIYCLTIFIWYVINYTKKEDFVQPAEGDDISRDQETIEEGNSDEKLFKRKWFFKFSRHEKNLIFAALVSACIGSLGILMCSIFDTRDFHHVHLTMVGIFLAGLAISVILTGTSFIMTGKDEYNRQNNEEFKLGYKFWTSEFYQQLFYNSWMISGVVKLIWVILAITWAICFGGVSATDISAVFEWLLSFWYGIIFVIWSVDMYFYRKLAEKDTV
ncbi:hypothetical protein QEN19_002702 [Hanseniaspora menglaensis]